MSGEVGESAAFEASARPSDSPRSWREFCASYRPHVYGKRSGRWLAQDADELQAILAAAIARMSTDGTSRRCQSGVLVEETTMGHCYEVAA